MTARQNTQKSLYHQYRHIMAISAWGFAIAFAAVGVKPELRPAQEIMPARVAWQGAIKTDLGNKNHEAVAAANYDFNSKCTDCHKKPM